MIAVIVLNQCLNDGNGGVPYGDNVQWNTFVDGRLTMEIMVAINSQRFMMVFYDVIKYLRRWRIKFVTLISRNICDFVKTYESYYPKDGTQIQHNKVGFTSFFIGPSEGQYNAGHRNYGRYQQMYTGETSNTI